MARWKLVLVQLAGVWAFGSVLTGMLVMAFVMALFGAPLIGLAVAVLGVAGLVFAGTVTADASPLTRARGTRLLWAVLVFAGGAAGLGSGAYADSALKLPFGENELVVAVLGGLPFALAAALLAVWWTAVPTLLVVVAVVGGAVTVIDDRKDATAYAGHLERLGVPRELLFTTRVAGYRPESVSVITAPKLTLRSVAAGAPAPAYYGADHITVRVERGTFPAADCRARLVTDRGEAGRPSCAEERPGLWRRTGTMAGRPEWGCPCGLREYVLRRGPLLVRASATDGVAAALVRDAALNARPATETEVRAALNAMYGPPGR
ncbi:hypothetical protein GCM10009678_57080 [Actinomadura kijaniata]|uniref:Uncharacterized protein n=1 Tax=Actinomadura namibiensis TaxID=182080 RepID=A0A7W3QKP0_ACTNM|nr:hypothetical protein [Actinomadura namibiensis]MBA8950143.1 hypothetical protein [Actinomadura namibiensis]